VSSTDAHRERENAIWKLEVDFGMPSDDRVPRSS
jgi:hypothetical protein